MPREHERRPRSRSRERHRESYTRDSRKHRSDRTDRSEGAYRDRERDYEDDRGGRSGNKRDRERDRDRRHRHERREERHRSRSLTRSRSPSPKSVPPVPENHVEEPVIEEPEEPMSDGEREMMRTLGFRGFDTTKGKHVVGNSVYVANVSKQRKYRQYMNRRGGFNRPLDPVG